MLTKYLLRIQDIYYLGPIFHFLLLYFPYH
uniref:Uncharacterized protein n=1 Tax=Ciona intestinalis TaxID=7719 RepID=H2XMV7_CIOIN